MILGKSDIGKLRLKTKLTEAKSVLESSPYTSQQEIAKKQLEMLQEEYKALTGEYAVDFLLKEEVNEEVKNGWEILSAKRKDGVVFNAGDKYKDGNGLTYTIKSMEISSNGKLMGNSTDGGAIDLYVVKKI